MNLIYHEISAINHKTTGAFARIEREAAGVTATAVARAMRVSKQTVSYLEAGKVRWKKQFADRYTRAVNKCKTTARP